MQHKYRIIYNKRNDFSKETRYVEKYTHGITKQVVSNWYSKAINISNNYPKLTKNINWNARFLYSLNYPRQKQRK